MIMTPLQFLLSRGLNKKSNIDLDQGFGDSNACDDRFVTKDHIHSF